MNKIKELEKTLLQKPVKKTAKKAVKTVKNVQKTAKPVAVQKNVEINLTGDFSDPVKFKNDPIAYSEWCRVLSILKTENRIHPVEQKILEMYCLSLSLYEKTVHIVQQEMAKPEFKMVYSVLSTGAMAVNPLINLLDNRQAHLLKLAKELGITPASRNSVKPVKSGDDTASKKNNKDLLLNCN